MTRFSYVKVFVKISLRASSPTSEPSASSALREIHRLKQKHRTAVRSFGCFATFPPNNKQECLFLSSMSSTRRDLLQPLASTPRHIAASFRLATASRRPPVLPPRCRCYVCLGYVSSFRAVPGCFCVPLLYQALSREMGRDAAVPREVLDRSSELVARVDRAWLAHRARCPPQELGVCVYAFSLACWVSLTRCRVLSLASTLWDEACVCVCISHYRSGCDQESSIQEKHEFFRGLKRPSSLENIPYRSPRG